MTNWLNQSLQSKFGNTTKCKLEYDIIIQCKVPGWGLIEGVANCEVALSFFVMVPKKNKWICI